MRFGFLFLALTMMGCANAATPPPAAPRQDGDSRLVSVDEDGHFHRADGGALSERDFRTLYVQTTHSFELEDELAHQEAKRENAIAIGIGVTSIAAGSVGTALYARSKDCAPSATVENREKCVMNAAESVALATLGVYVLSCEVVAGLDCVRKDAVMKVKIGPAHLDRARAAFYADRYNDAIAGQQLDDAPRVQPVIRKAHLLVTPSGLNGTF